MPRQAIRELYSDLSASFGRDRVGNLSIVTDIDSVEESIDTILLTPLRSRKFLPEFGSNLLSILWEPISPGTAILIQTEVRRAINRWDPRLVITNVIAVPYEDDNAWDIVVAGYIAGLKTFTYSRRLATEGQ